MAWVRVGDDAFTHPRLMGVYDVEEAKSIPLHEVFGFLLSLAAYSAKHLTGGIIERGAVYTVGSPDRVSKLLDVCLQAGLIQWVEVKGKRKLQLFTDEEFIHIRSREEVMAQRARSRENRDPKLKSAVLHRDGDTCRYCGKIVRWTGPIGYNVGTLDHVDPDSVGSVSVDGLLVACHHCNSSRQAAREDFDTQNPPLPVPATPYYSQWTADFLNRNGYTVRPSAEPPTPISSDAQTCCVVPGDAPSVDRRDAAESARAASRVDLGGIDHPASGDPLDEATQAPADARGIDLGGTGHPASGDLPRASKPKAEESEPSPNLVRTKSEPVFAAEGSQGGLSRVGSGRTGKRPGRAGTGQEPGRNRDGEAMPSPQRKPRRKRRNKRSDLNG